MRLCVEIHRHTHIYTVTQAHKGASSSVKNPYHTMDKIKHKLIYANIKKKAQECIHFVYNNNYYNNNK